MNKNNNIDEILKHITIEKDKLEKLTKKVIPSHNTHNTHNPQYKIRNLTNLKNNNNNNVNSNTKKIVKIGKDAVANMGNNIEIEKIIGIDINNLNSKSLPNNKSLSNNNINIKKILNITEDEFKNSSPEKIKEIMELLQNYIKMDKSYLIKHEELKKLYTEYSNLYNKKKQTNNVVASNTIGNNNAVVSNNLVQNTVEDNKHQEMLKTIHGEMKDNNTNLYRSRLMILKKIKEEPHIEPVIKNRICGSLLAIFKSPPHAEYKQFPMLKDNEEKITIKELDNAYLQKHNELMTVYKAYQNLFNKVLNYKDQLDKYKQLPTGSLISREKMNKLMEDQGFVMNMIDKMQDELVSKNIISNIEKVPINPVASNPQNIETFNDTMRDQIKHIIDRQVEVKPHMKTKIEDLLSQYKDCDTNDQFCHAGRKLLLIKKL